MQEYLSVLLFMEKLSKINLSHLRMKDNYFYADVSDKRIFFDPDIKGYNISVCVKDSNKVLQKFNTNINGRVKPYDMLKLAILQTNHILTKEDW